MYLIKKLRKLRESMDLSLLDIIINRIMFKLSPPILEEIRQWNLDTTFMYMFWLDQIRGSTLRADLKLKKCSLILNYWYLAMPGRAQLFLTIKHISFIFGKQDVEQIEFWSVSPFTNDWYWWLCYPFETVSPKNNSLL